VITAFFEQTTGRQVKEGLRFTAINIAF